MSYLRVSTKEQASKGGRDEGFSIPAQREANLRKARDLNAIIVEEFVDAGESARKADRPELMRMIEYVKTHPVAYCIVHKVDRLARNRASEVAKGMNQKARTGGTNGKAPIGYLNVTKRDDLGREMRIVESDPERAALVKWAFEAYATGNYSTITLREELIDLGLTTVSTNRSSPPRSGTGCRRCSPRTRLPVRRPKLTTTISKAVSTVASAGRG